MGNLKFQVKGLKKLKVEPATTSRLEEQKPSGRPSGWNPFSGQTAPDRGQTAPDRGQTAPDRGQTPPDRGQTPDEPADRPPRKDLAQVMGNVRVRVKGLRKQRVEPVTMDPSQSAQDSNQDRMPPRKAMAQVMGNLRFQVKGLKMQRVEPATTSRLEEEKPSGRPSGRSPFPALDPSQIPDEPADRPPRKDLSQVMGNVRVWFRGLRKQRVEHLPPPCRIRRM
ncbi:unnamed protein product [Boreogadus saida]